MVARLELSEGAVSDPLAAQIEKRFTWRGAFSTLPVRLFGWSRGDAVFVMDAPVRGWLAQLNDQASFHRPIGESAVSSGRAYLRLCLEAAHLGLAGWPMAALTDDPDAAEQISVQLAIGPDRQLIQVLRFGVPTGTPPPRARRPLQELISTPLG